MVSITSTHSKDESNDSKCHKTISTIWNQIGGHQVDLRGHNANDNDLVATRSICLYQGGRIDQVAAMSISL